LAACALLGSLSVASVRAQDSTISGDTENAKCSLSPLNTKPQSLVLSPRTKVFVPAAQRAGLNQKRIALFGDMFAMNKDTPPRVSDGLRAIFAVPIWCSATSRRRSPTTKASSSWTPTSSSTSTQTWPT
jgi:hypothetical protein